MDISGLDYILFTNLLIAGDKVTKQTLKQIYKKSVVDDI